MRPATFETRPAPRGFTLIELMACVALIGLMATIMVSYGRGGARGRKLDAIAKATLAAVATARSHAMATGERTCVSMQADAIVAFVDGDGDNVYSASDKLLSRYPSDGRQSLQDGQFLPGFATAADALQPSAGAPMTANFDARGYFVWPASQDELRDANVCLKDAQGGASTNVYLSRLGWTGITRNAACVAN